MSTNLAAALGRFHADGPLEQAHLAQLRGLATTPDPWDRSRPFHVTASALVLHPPSGRVLLRWHDRLERWMHVGGHGEPGEGDPFAIARREAEEETGLGDLVAWPDPSDPALIQVVVVDVPASNREPAHRHADIRYLVATARPEDIRPESPSTPLRWLGFDEAIDFVGADNVAVALRRARAGLDHQ